MDGATRRRRSRPMQKLLLDVAIAGDQRVYEAPARAIAGWLFLIAQASISENGGRFRASENFARFMPDDASMSDVLSARLAWREGDEIVVYRYSARAELEYRAKSEAGKMTAQKRWGAVASNVASNDSKLQRKQRSKRYSSSTDIHTYRHTDIASSSVVNTEINQEVTYVQPEREHDELEPLTDTAVDLGGNHG